MYGGLSLQILGIFAKIVCTAQLGLFVQFTVGSINPGSAKTIFEIFYAFLKNWDTLLQETFFTIRSQCLKRRNDNERVTFKMQDVED